MENEGVRHKPKECNLCKLAYFNTGFCPDIGPEKPKMMLLLEHPLSQDVIEQVPLSGNKGKWFYMNVLKPLNLKSSDLLLSHVLRCKSPNREKKPGVKSTLPLYPAEKLSRTAENHCRVHDKLVKKFDPNLFVFSYGLLDTHGDPAFLALLLEDMKKGLKFAQEGNRVCVCLGTNAVSFIDKTPFKPGKGGLRQWRGHYFYGSWPN